MSDAASLKPGRKAPRNQPSSIDRLPPEVQDEIAKLRTRMGLTIDELLAWVKDQGHEISRTAMGRHVRHLHLDVERAGGMLNRAQSISTAVMERLGEKPDNDLARLNIQLLHSQVFDMIVAEEEADAETGEMGEKPKPTALEMVRLSKAIQQLLSAEKMNAERAMAIRKAAIAEERERAAAALEATLDEKKKGRSASGLTRATVDEIKREILGVV